MKRAKSPKGSSPQGDSTNDPTTHDGTWVIEMRRAGSGGTTVEQSKSRTPSSHDLFEQTFHHLRGFLDRLYR